MTLVVIQEDNLDDVKLANSTEASSKANKQPEAKKQKKPKVQVISLPIESFVPGMSKSEIDLGLEKEGKMAAQDKLEKERADAKNAVEEYVYEMREKLDAQLQNFISEKDKESFSSLLTRTEDWLYDEGEDEQKNVYVDKLAQLRKHGNPVVKRWQESESRPQAFDDLGKALVHYRKVIDLYSQKHELYDHIEESEMKKVEEEVASKQKWMEEKMQAQGKLASHLDPAVLTAKIVSEKESLQKNCDPIVNKPKPKVEPPKDEEKKENGNEGQKVGGEGSAEGEQTKDEGESKMDVEGQSADKASGSNDMDLD
jgi:hypothetical protein